MRVSTNTIYERSITSVQQGQTDLLKTQQQLSTGRRMLTPADDPVASARALELTQSLSITKQYVANANPARSSLGMEESVLSSIGEVIHNVRVSAVQAGNPTLSKADRLSLATEVRSRYQELLGLANSTDSTGDYMFSGYQGRVKPFTQTTGAAVYAGDQGLRLIQISPSRRVEVSDSGATLFKPGTTQDMFKVIDDFAGALETLPPGAALDTAISTALDGLTKSMDNVLTVRAAVGAHLNEIDSAQNGGEESILQFQKSLSGLQDLDYAKAISDLTQQQMTLEAAQKSFLKVTGLSLFNYINP